MVIEQSTSTIYDRLSSRILTPRNRYDLQFASASSVPIGPSLIRTGLPGIRPIKPPLFPSPNTSTSPSYKSCQDETIESITEMFYDLSVSPPPPPSPTLDNEPAFYTSTPNKSTGNDTNDPFNAIIVASTPVKPFGPEPAFKIDPLHVWPPRTLPNPLPREQRREGLRALERVDYREESSSDSLNASAAIFIHAKETGTPVQSDGKVVFMKKSVL